MNTLVISDTNLIAKQYAGQRVVTLNDIDIVHKRPKGTARNRFNSNKKHFIEGQDFFNISKGDILMSEKGTLEIPNRGLIVLTESGYLMIVKSFTDDLSWNVQRQLINGYFKSKSITLNSHKIDTEVSTRPLLPSARGWYNSQKQRIFDISKKENLPIKTIYHLILSQIDLVYDIQAAKVRYRQERGYWPKYLIDMVSYFNEMQPIAEKVFSDLEKKGYEWVKEYYENI